MDDLFDDLNDLSDNDEENPIKPNEILTSSSSQTTTPTPSLTLTLAKNISDTCKLLATDAFTSHIKSISSSPSSAFSLSSASHSINSSPDYGRILTSNKFLTDLEEELTLAHNFLKQQYKPKFPELEEIVVDRLDYSKAVKVLWNHSDLSPLTASLNSILPNNTVIMISVAGSTGSGRQLTDQELAKVSAACDEMEKINAMRSKLILFVESKMMTIAPNCCVLVGASITARIMGLAGGLDKLSRIPSCNLQVFGQKRLTATARAGFGNQAQRPNFGIVGECELVAGVSEAMKQKALKVVSAKLTLCARCDAVNSSSGREGNSSTGDAMRAELEEKLRKWDEPDKARTKKALPKPEMSTKKKRGGKRVRKQKEMFALTEVHKAANKRSFMEVNGEYGDDAMGMDMGMLGDAKIGGALRGVKATQKVKLNENSKQGKKRAIQMSGGSGSTNGLASSMVFTQTQGLELVAPKSAVERVADANKNWFGNNSGFASAKPK